MLVSWESGAGWEKDAHHPMDRTANWCSHGDHSMDRTTNWCCHGDHPMDRTANWCSHGGWCTLRIWPHVSEKAWLLWFLWSCFDSCGDLQENHMHLGRLQECWKKQQQQQQQPASDLPHWCFFDIRSFLLFLLLLLLWIFWFSPWGSAQVFMPVFRHY